MIRLPRDVLEHVNSKIRKTIILCLLLTAAILAFLAVMGERVFGDMGYVCQYTSYALLVCLPSVCLKIWKLFTDKNRFGRIASVEVRTVYEPNIHERSKNFKAFVNIVELTVEWDGGKTDLVKINVGDKKPEHFLGDYKVGFHVYRFKGLDNVLIADPERDDLAYCAVCGGRASSKETGCKNCGYTMIRGADLNK